jgi:hypothetical protein
VVYQLISGWCRDFADVEPDEACYAVFVPSFIRLERRVGRVVHLFFFFFFLFFWNQHFY